MNPLTKYQIKSLWRSIRYPGCFLVLFVLLLSGLALGMFLNYNTEETVTAKVVSINTRLEVGGGGDEITHATTTYLVSTDKGVFKIQPDGLMASPAFGMLEAGKTYRLHVRGIRNERMKYLPYIIEAEEVE